ncbi:D-alanyl-D-alanine carboxypeptidase, partial [[Clostridium] symbiosum]
MNDKAAELGMEDTHFSNTHGYHDDDHYTSAYDIYLMCREAMKHETFRTIVGSKNYTMPATNLHPEPRIIRSTNALISNFRVAGYIYEYATGIKTGSTPEAGYCLAASATRENRNLISVVMGCEREPGTSGSEGYIYFDETIRLFKWGFANFSTQTILD